MISQPRYLPTMSYLNRIKESDVFILYDTVQRVERGYENRNKIRNKSNGVEKWLTIPIESSNRTLIKDTLISGYEWKIDHINKVHQYYQDDMIDIYYGVYLSKMLSANYSECLLNGLKFLTKLYNIDTEIILASELTNKENGGIMQLISLTKQVGGDTYISGPTCLDYGLTHELAMENGIKLQIDMNKNYVIWFEELQGIIN